MAASLEERMASLERGMRLWRASTVLACAVAVTALAAVLVSRRVPGDIVARSVSLIGRDGTAVAKLVELPGRGPLLTMHADEIDADVTIGSFGPDAGIALTVHDQPMATLAVGKLGGPALSLGGAERSVLVSLGDDGSPVVWLRDATGLFLARPSGIEVRDPKGGPVFSSAPGAVGPRADP